MTTDPKELSETRSQLGKAGGKKSGEIRRAQAEAKRTGLPVDLPQYDQRILPDGSAVVLSEQPMDESELETFEAAVGDADFEVVEMTDEDMRPDAPTAPDRGLLDIANELAAAGLSQDEAILIAQQRLGMDVSPAIAERAHQMTPGSGEQMGPDLDMVRRYEQRQRDYVAPKLRTTVSVEVDGEVHSFQMKVRDADYIAKKAMQYTIGRRRDHNPVSPAEALAILIGEHKRDDQEFALWSHPHAASGPADAFNAASGTYG